MRLLFWAKSCATKDKSQCYTKKEKGKGKKKKKQPISEQHIRVSGAERTQRPKEILEILLLGPDSIPNEAWGPQRKEPEAFYTKSSRPNPTAVWGHDVALFPSQG